MRTKFFKNKVLLTITFFCIGCIGMNAQIRVSGTVIEAKEKLPIIGATVMEDGTSNGTVTDVNGNFSIMVKGSQSSLVFSYIGMRTAMVQVGKQSNITVSLTENPKELEELVVIGYGTAKKSDLTGSVSSMRSKDIEESRSNSFTSAMAGQIAGVSAIQSGGAPGSGIDMKIRGAGSISAGSTPLYVIDGIMMENSDLEISAASRLGGASLDPMAMINPDEILSIEVLKDASATAIYGSRGANGVVLITTKSGLTDGTASITFSSDWSVDYTPQKRIDVLSGPEYEDYMGLKNPLGLDFVPDNTPLTETQARYWNPDGTVIRTGIDRNWQNEIFRTAPSQNYNFSYSGGTNQASYSFTTGYLEKQGIVKNSDMNRFTFGGKIDSQFSNFVQVGININSSFVTNSGVVSADGQTANNLFVQMLIFRPNVTDEQTEDPDLSPDDPASFSNNPVINVDNIIQQTRSRRIQGRGYIRITPVRNLNINSSFGGYTTDAKTKNFYPSITGPGRWDKGRIIHASSGMINWQNDNTITYNHRIDRFNRMNFMGGITFQRVTTENIQTTAINIEDESLGVESLQFGQTVNAVNTASVYSIMSYLGRVNYFHKDKYILTGSFRADGSSKFAPGNKFSFFPSAAFAWKMNEERFLRNIDEIDLLKLRLSYGVTGNQAIPPLSNIALLNRTYYTFNTEQGTKGSPALALAMIPGSLGNDNLKWETTSQYNAGLDLMVLKSRVNLTIDFYYKKTYDLLIAEQLPGIHAYTDQIRNIGSLRNKGLEITLNTLNLKQKKLSWTTDLNLSFNRNKVLDIGSGDRIPVTPGSLMQGKYTDVFYVREGYPIGAMFGYETDGLYQCQDFNEFYDSESNFISDLNDQKIIFENAKGIFTLRPGVVDRGQAVAPGYIKLKSQTGSDVINPLTDKVFLGSTEPLFFGGVRNRFGYKGLELSVFLQFSYGNKLFNTNHAMSRGYGRYNIERDYYENMWLIDRQDGKYYHFNDNATGADFATDLQAEDASYLKIKDITLSYSFQGNLLRQLPFKSVRLYVSTKNMFTFTNYSWYDPEYSSRNPLFAGLDRYAYPVGRTVIGGLTINL